MSYSIRDRGNPSLIAALASRIQERGPMTFAEFMANALYHPRYGYYLASTPVGFQADFYTSPEVHPAFGVLIAYQLREMWQAMGRPAAFDIVEFGGGTGAVADSILGWSVNWADFCGAVRYTIVETSPALQDQQQARLARWQNAPDGPILTWREPGRTLMPVSCLTGCLLANELLDALPFHRVRVIGGKLREVFVDFKDGDFVERIAEPSTPRLQAYFDDLDLMPAEDAVAEVNLAMLDWIEAAATAIDRGWLLLFDYGYPAIDMFAPARPRGTLQCHFRHTLNENPYRRIGQQDITAHVDLTSLIQHAERQGLRPIGCVRQRSFLHNLGLAEYDHSLTLAKLPPDEQHRNRRALAELARPDGLGALWAIGFGLGVESSTLSGFSGGDAVRSQVSTADGLPTLRSAFETEYPEFAEMWREAFDRPSPEQSAGDQTRRADDAD